MITPAIQPPSPVRRLPGMRDWPADAWCRADALCQQFRDLAGQRGYAPVDIPILEPTELFMRKSGGALASRMYSFIDPGSSSVSLRPEFTSSIMRHYLETAAPSGAFPVARWQYAGPVFRYDTQDAAGSGQFSQIGAELIGNDAIHADAELLTLAAAVPDALDLPDCRLRLADLSVLNSVLDTASLSDRARSFIIANMNRIGVNHDLSPLLERARELHIISPDASSPEPDSLASAVAGLPDYQAREVLFGILRWNGSDAAITGQRTPDEIVNRLLRKLRGGDRPDDLALGLRLAAQLAGIKGSPDAALASVQTIVAAAGADPAPVNRLSGLLRLIAPDPHLRHRLSIDFSLARGISYYNGIIFDLVCGPDAASLGGGGRYDALARALGSPHNIPALGFACTLETLLRFSPSPTPTLPQPNPR